MPRSLNATVESRNQEKKLPVTNDSLDEFTVTQIKQKIEKTIKLTSLCQGQNITILLPKRQGPVHNWSIFLTMTFKDASNKIESVAWEAYCGIKMAKINSVRGFRRESATYSDPLLNLLRSSD